MKHKQIDPAGGAEDDESKKAKNVGLPCDQSPLPREAARAERKVIDDALRFDDVRNHASLMRYSDERTVEETHGPNGHQRRFTQRRTFHVRSTDWRLAVGIAGVCILCFVAWLLLNKPAP